MDIESEQLPVGDNALVQFCLQQRKSMSEPDWMEFSNETGREKLGLVALILASDPWYGHRDALMRIAEELGALHYHPALRKCLDQNFNLPRFANMLRVSARHIKVER